jgi:hypothetical protein
MPLEIKRHNNVSPPPAGKKAPVKQGLISTVPKKASKSKLASTKKQVANSTAKK